MSEYLVVARSDGTTDLYETIPSRGTFIPLDGHGHRSGEPVEYGEATHDWAAMSFRRDLPTAMSMAGRLLPCPACGSVRGVFSEPGDVRCPACRFEVGALTKMTAIMAWNLSRPHNPSTKPVTHDNKEAMEMETIGNEGGE